MSSSPSGRGEHPSRITVVIPTLNRRQQLEIALDPVLSDPAVDEIVVVDDGSTDTTPDYLRQLAASDRRVKAIAGPRRGAGWARQAGAQVAEGDLVLFLDDDVVARPGLAAAHLSAHRGRSGVVMLGYMPVADALLGARDSVVARIYQADYEAQAGEYETEPDTILKMLWGGNFSMSRADALRVGLGQEAAVWYHEDQDFGLRCMRHGLVGAFDRALAADHWHVRSLRHFLETARISGRDGHLLCAAYPEILGSVSLGASSGLPALPAALLVVARCPSVTAVTLGLLERLIPALRPWRRGQTAVAVLARAIATRRGILDAREAARA